jgi:HEPN domain-containing protein
MTRDEIVRYWIDSANQDYQVTESLFANGHYVWSLFVGHLVVEKLLKAYHVKKADADYPRTHNLLRIAQGAALELTDDQRLLLDEVTAFNIRARYPDYKNRFGNTANQEFTQQYIEKIRGFRQWLSKEMTR